MHVKSGVDKNRGNILDKCSATAKGEIIQPFIISTANTKFTCCRTNVVHASNCQCIN